MKTNLQPIKGDKLEVKKAEWSIDEPYRKPKLKAPYFESSLVKPEPDGHLRRRLAELVKKPEINKQVKVSGLRAWLMRVVK